MGKVKQLRQDLQNFLLLFSFEIDTYYDLDKRLRKKEHINIKDKNGDIIGDFYMDEKENLYFKAALNNSCFFAKGYSPKDNNRYFFDFTIEIPEDEINLKGSMKSRKDFESACLDFLLEISIYDHEKFISNYKFNSAFELFDIVKFKQKINYHRNRLKYNRDGRSFLIFYDEDGIFYNDMDFDEQHLNRITGGYAFPVTNNQESFYVEEEFNKVITEICPDYFDFVKEQINLFNKFNEDLFENIIELVYRNINPKKMEYIIGNLNAKQSNCLKKIKNDHK